MVQDKRIFRKRAVERAVDREVSIRPSTLKGEYLADSISGKQYRLKPSLGGFRCLTSEDEQCPSEKYHGTCKHVAALDLYFLENGIDNHAHVQTVQVKANGKIHTFNVG